MEKTYRGKLDYTGNGEEDDLLSIESDIKLAETLMGDIEKYGRYLTVRYVISDKEIPIGKMEEAIIRTLFGIGEAEYFVNYSEYTGYLWTDEELKVGEHDLLEELKSHMGKWLHMGIVFNVNENKKEDEKR